MNIDAVLSPPEIDLLPQRDLSGVICVIFDVLRATSTILTALAGGVREIFPVCTIEEALALKAGHPEARLGGERHGDRIDGFDLGNSPLEYRSLAAKQIITTTTNGTVALRACEQARETLAGALLNMDALVAHLKRQTPENLLLVCAGTFRELALEDVFAAGMLCAALPGAVLSDAALAAQALFQQYQADPWRALTESKNGRVLLAKNREADVRWCAQVSVCGVVGVMRGGKITA
jgi:2-phosphosulfolactate phosphatase